MAEPLVPNPFGVQVSPLETAQPDTFIPFEAPSAPEQPASAQQPDTFIPFSAEQPDTFIPFKVPGPEEGGKISASSNFWNSFRNQAYPSRAFYADAVDLYASFAPGGEDERDRLRDKADSIREKFLEESPERPGFSGIAGSALGQGVGALASIVAAVAEPTLAGEAAVGGVLLKRVLRLLPKAYLGTVAVRGGGGAARKAVQRREAGQPVSLTDERLAAIGGGVIEWATEAISLGGITKVAEGITRAAMMKIGKAIIAKRPAKEVAGLIVKGLAESSFLSAKIEGTEEVIATIANALMEKFYADLSIGEFASQVAEEAPSAFLGGAIAGAALGPLGAGAAGVFGRAQVAEDIAAEEVEQKQLAEVVATAEAKIEAQNVVGAILEDKPIDARFIGFQEDAEGQQFPLFNVIKSGHPLEGSTVSELTLRNEGLEVPKIAIEKKVSALLPAVQYPGNVEITSIGQENLDQNTVGDRIILFHGTTERELPLIMKEGIKGDISGTYGPSLTSRISNASIFASQKASNTELRGEGIFKEVILRVDIPLLEVSKVKRNISDISFSLDLATIPSSWIKAQAFEGITTDPNFDVAQVREAEAIPAVPKVVPTEPPPIPPIDPVAEALSPEEGDLRETVVRDIGIARTWKERFIDTFDIVNKWTRQGAIKLGRAIQGIHGFSATMEERGLRVLKEISKGLGYDKFLMGQVVLAAEDIDAFRAREGKWEVMREVDYETLRLPTEILREYLDQTLTDLKTAGILQHGFKENLQQRLNEELTKARNKKDTEAIASLTATLESIDGMGFVPIPYYSWFEKSFTDPAGRRRLTFFAKKKRTTFRISDLVKEGIIEESEINVADVLGSYTRRSSRDLALANVVNTAKEEGFAFAPPEKGGDSGQYKEALGKGYMPADPIDAPLFSGHLIHPLLQKWIHEMVNVRRGNPFIKIMNMVKMFQFINPVILPMYDTVQGIMLGTFFHVGNLTHPFKSAKMYKDAILDVWNKSDTFLEAGKNNLFSVPFPNPVDSWQSAINRASTPIRSQVWEPFTGLLGEKGARKFIMSAYNLSWHTAWTMDHAIRMMSYRYLTDVKGLSTFNAAQMAASFHGDYSSVPPATRHFLNHVFFTPTFKIVMGKLYGRMVRDMITLPVRKMSKKGKKTAKDIKQIADLNARGLLGVASILITIEAMMMYLGFDREEFGRKYSKRDFDDDGNVKDIVLNFSNPANIFLKYIQRVQASVGPDVTNPLKEFFRLNKWEIHPLWRAGFEIKENRDGLGEEIYNPFDSSPLKMVKMTSHAIFKSVRLFEAFEYEEKGRAEANKLLRRSIGKDFDNDVTREIALLFEMILRPFTFRYVKDPGYIQIVNDIKRIQRTFMTVVREGKYSEKIAQAYMDRLNKLIEDLEAEFPDLTVEQTQPEKFIPFDPSSIVSEEL